MCANGVKVKVKVKVKVRVRVRVRVKVRVRVRVRVRFQPWWTYMHVHDYSQNSTSSPTAQSIRKICTHIVILLDNNIIGQAMEVNDTHSYPTSIYRVRTLCYIY